MNYVKVNFVPFEKIGTNMEAEKLELIHWITNLADAKVLQKILEIKHEAVKKQKKIRMFGSGKEVIGNIADDFNEPLEDFKVYSK